MCRFVIGALVAVCVCSSGIWAAGGSSKPSRPAGPSLAEQAVKDYNDGLKHRDKAWEHETKAAAAEKTKDVAKYKKKAAKEYQKAIKKQLQATQKNSRFHEAFSSLGYAYRKTGQYELALKAYDRALALDPNYTEAIEYRAEAYLGLGRVKDAQAAYEQLFSRDPKRAEQLLKAFDDWLTAPEREPEVAEAELEQVRTWVQQQQQEALDMSGTQEEGAKEW